MFNYVSALTVAIIVAVFFMLISMMVSTILVELFAAIALVLSVINVSLVATDVFNTLKEVF